jgi:diacylglycerol kinase (ATP)
MPKKFAQSLTYAGRGIRHAFWTQRNIRIHLFIAAVIFGFGVYLQLSYFELIALTIMICFVLISEMINTSIEEIVNLVAPAKSVPAMIAKDVAAGAVLFSSICAIIVGCLIFIPHLSRR